MRSEKGLVVLSLFDGMSCGQIALKELGIKVDKYYASEVDKFAVQQSILNFPNTIHLGDVTRWREWNIDWNEVDLVIGGSPCQGFSFAGKQLAFDDPRSKLFFVFSDIVHHVMSLNENAKFLLENVRMKKEYLDVISKTMEVEPININSNLVSAQNRNRFYWTNIEGVVQPEDREIFLKDILESEVDEKYYLSEDKLSSGYMSRNYLQVDSSGLGHKSQNDRFYYPSSKHSSLTAGGTKGKTGVYLGDRIRRLTPSECAKLQTIPSWYKWDCSDTQQYKMLGNGWTVEVIKHIFSKL